MGNYINMLFPTCQQKVAFKRGYIIGQHGFPSAAKAGQHSSPQAAVWQATADSWTMRAEAEDFTHWVIV